MFYDLYDYNIDLMSSDTSLHDGIPKYYYHLKDKKFNDWEIPPWELFIFTKRLLGEGSFAKVYLAKWRETFVVAKVINPNICKNEKDLVLREFEIMTKLHHPNIVQFLGYIDEPFVIVMEYIPNGDLLENIEKHSLSKENKKNIMRDVLQGLAYIHNRLPYSLIHRDIKPTNILLTNSKVAKITDFGLSKFNNIYKSNSNNNLITIDENNSQNNCTIFKDLTINVGTERYMAPEISEQKSYNNKIDIYSCGILLYEMFESKRYIPGEKFSWYYTPKKIKTIILNNMLCKVPEERLNSLNILKIYNKLT
jgi:serine/threonine protein kinase